MGLACKQHLARHLTPSPVTKDYNAKIAENPGLIVMYK